MCFSCQRSWIGGPYLKLCSLPYSAICYLYFLSGVDLDSELDFWLILDFKDKEKNKKIKVCNDGSRKIERLCIVQEDGITLTIQSITYPVQ